MSVWAVLAAAGRGERLGLDRPKAFARLRGRPLLAESLERLEESGWVDAIVVRTFSQGVRQPKRARRAGLGVPALPLAA